MALGDWRRAAGDFRGAAEGYREAVSRFESVGDRRGAVRASWLLGKSLVDGGELEPAVAILARVTADFRELGDLVGEAQAQNTFGSTRRHLGEPQLALAAYRRAHDLYRQAGDESGQGSSLNNQGIVLENTADLEGAIDLYEQALVIWRRLGLRSYEAITLENLGRLYSLVGHDREALSLLEQSVAMQRKAGEERSLITALNALGWAEYLVGRPEAALERYEEALRLARRFEDRMSEAGILDRRGTALKVLGRTAEASDCYRRSLAISRETSGRSSAGHTLANLGWLELETGKVEPGRRHLSRALTILTESGDLNGQAYARGGLARAERLRGNFGLAREHLETAAGLVEEVRSGLRGDTARSTFLATRYNAFEELVALHMELHRRAPGQGHEQRALEVAERARSQTLLEVLAPKDSARDGEIAGRRRVLIAEIEALEAQRLAVAAKGRKDPRLARIEKTLRERWLELDRLDELPAVQEGSRPAPLTAKEIQALLDPDTMFVVYLLAEPESFAWTVDLDRIDAHVLPGRASIEALARSVAETIPHSHETAVRDHAARAAAELSTAVLAPVASRIAGRRRLVLLLDGALHAIPFAALPAPGGQDVAEPLIVRHEIVTPPSATFLAYLRSETGRRPPPDTVAVIGDPVFTQEDERLGGRSHGKVSLPADLERAVEDLDIGRLERLPYTAREAAAILGLVPRGKGLAALGFAAQRELVLSGELGRYGILHFATHGLAHPVLPELSGVVLSLLDPSGRAHDGFLRAYEIAELDLPADLVVLSACQTGLGPEVRGEGLVGLTQAFFRAGARRVLVSHWNVKDRATAELMARLYRGMLSEGLSPAAALRAAQLSILDEEPWKSPQYWAGFSLRGDWR
jgi:CHAT domain-containing protein/Tfp pilus assembly protein PilF